MGIQNGQEQARQVVTGTFTAASQASASFVPDVLGVLTGHPLTKFSVAAWSASPSANTVADIQRSYDGGTNWIFGGDEQSIYAGMAVTLEQTEPGVLYRVATVNGFAGSLTYRISQ